MVSLIFPSGATLKFENGHEVVIKPGKNVVWNSFTICSQEESGSGVLLVSINEGDEPITVYHNRSFLVSDISN